MVDTINYKNLVWVDVTSPSQEDISMLQKIKQFKNIDFEDALPRIQRSRYEDYEDYKYIVLHFPIINKKTGRLIIEEIDIFMNKNFLITFHSNRLLRVSDFFLSMKNNPEILNSYFSYGCEHICYKLILDLILSIFPLMKYINNEIEEIDSNLENIKSDSLISRISALRHNIIFLQTSLKPHRNIFMMLEREMKSYSQECEISWQDLENYITKIVETAEDSQEFIEGLYSSIDTLLTYKTNEGVKILTLWSVILLPLTAITGFYGMNVKLPLAESPHAVLYIFLIMIAVIIGLLIYFKVTKI